MGAITFRASFPAIQSAIKRSGDGGGMRIQLDIPESEMAQAVHLLALTSVILRITVEVDADQPTARRKSNPTANRDFTIVDTEKTHDG